MSNNFKFRWVQGGPVLVFLVGLAYLGSQPPGRADAGRSNCAEGPATAHRVTRGTPCAEVIVAGHRVRRVFGGGGNDRIYATAAGQSVYGGGGRDRIYASPEGEVTAKGGKGADVIYGHLPPSVDKAPALSRPAVTYVSSCPSACYLGDGSQTFDGGPGPDVVFGERGNDALNGGGGNDLLYSGIGDDTERGGDGNDLLSGGWGADNIDGQVGNDYVRGDGTSDTLQDTGGGTDTLSYVTGVTPGFPDKTGYPNFSSYRNFPASGGERGVYVDLSSGVADNNQPRYGGGVDTIITAPNFENVIGTPFSDYIVGSTGNNTVYGGGGGDVILGSAGNDTLYGGADGDHLDGGAGQNSLRGNAGADYCVGTGELIACEPSVNTGGVVLRDASKISVGVMGPETATYTQLYLLGSNVRDSVSATFSQGPPGRVTFNIVSGSAGFFDTATSSRNGCGAPTTTQVVCTLGTRLDAIVLAGMGGGDTLQANGIPTWGSLVNIGGEGGDTLSSGAGGAYTEDVLVDGPDATGPGADTLNAFKGDDALLNNDGADQLFAGDGNDLFLSTTICDGDLLNGGLGRDNSSWGRYKVSGIEARIGDGIAGRPGTGTGPDCGTETLDTLQEIDDLEGTSLADILYGSAGPNHFLGRGGSDEYYGLGGNEVITANSGDLDPVISCGPDTDTVVIDFPQYGDVPDADCEFVSEAAPKNIG